MDSPSRRSVFLHSTLPLLVLLCTSILAYLSLIQTWSLRETSLSLKAGDVAGQDLRAPRNIEYVSTVLTQAARDAAERAIAPVYIPPDPAIARAQNDSLTSILQAISNIRVNETISPDDKRNAVAAIQGITLQADMINYLLGLSDSSWSLVRSEAYNVLGQTLRNPVRTEDLDNVRQNLASAVSFSLTERQAELVVDLVSPLIVANSFYSPELTEAARQKARDSVQPVSQVFVEGQTVITRGHVITAADLEALTALGLVQENKSLYGYIGPAALVILASLFTGMYFKRRPLAAFSDLRSLLLLSGLFVLFLFATRIVIPNRTIIPYLFPVPAFALLVSALLGMERGMVFGLLMSVMAAYAMPDSLALMPYYILSSLCGVLALGQGRRVGQFLYAAVAAAVAGAAVVAAYRIPFTDMDLVGMGTLLGAAGIMGLASAGLALPLQFLLAQFLGMTTAIQLLEISRPDSPLLVYFLQRAPGTYQHSLQVANLSEQAADRVHADPLLTRVGALFHDIGKASNPLFFVENQPANAVDSHDDLDPAESAETIIRHVKDGLVLAKKYRLPRRLQDFISEHHGTLITRYQYNRAVQAAGGDATKVDESRFHYPGPTPRSKETAILMFADGVEASARAERPSDETQLRALVNKVIESRQKMGQLADAPLSQKDLSTIADSFVSTLKVTYHPRLEYPSEPAAVIEPATQPLPGEKPA